MKIKLLKNGTVIVLSAAVLLLSTAGISSKVKADASNAITRLGGVDRYDTAVKIASAYNGGTLQNVILATGDDFPDSLSGNVLAAKLKAPILLVQNNAKYSMTALDFVTNKLAKDGTIYFLGGNGVVSDDIQSYLTGKGYSKFVRLGGVDRFATNKAIKDQLKVATGTPVFLVRADNFPDALSVSSIAAIKGWPIILTDSNGLSQSAKDMISQISPNQVFLAGGNGVLTDQIVSDVKTLLPAIPNQNIVRLGGKDRYDTSAAVMNYFKLNTSNCVVATGDSFPDGIAGGVLAAKLNAPILLMNDDTLSKQKPVADSAYPSSFTILGGTGAISPTIENSLKTTANGVYGFDCASKYTLAKYQQFKATGYSFVARYYCNYNPSMDWKNPLTADEARDITNAGLKIVAVYEDGGHAAPYFTAAQGRSDCLNAINQANTVGQPAGTPIYFAVDYDTATTNNNFDGIRDYFNAIKQAMTENGNKYKIGVYGSNAVVSYVSGILGADTYIWQTYAWSSGVLNTKYNVYQYLDDVTDNSINIDRDIINNANNLGAFTVTAVQN